MDRFSADGICVELSAWTSAPDHAVWRVVADPFSFSDWVSGTRQIRAADADWPAPGTRLAHRWGVWPLRSADETRVVACEPRRRLDMHVGVRPVAVVRASVRLEPASSGTLIVLRECVVSGVACVAPPLTAAFQRWRNRRSLAALLDLAEASG